MDVFNLGYGGTVLLGFVAALILAVLLQLFVWMGSWRTLQRMGRHDFAALVPGYGTWELCRGAGFGPGFATVMVLLLGGQVVCAVLLGTVVDQGQVQQQFSAVINGSDPSVLEALGVWGSAYTQELYGDHSVLVIVTGAIGALYLILMVCVYYGTARSFGHGLPFALGLLLFPFIFFMVLGFSSKQVFEGPYFSKAGPSMTPAQWASLVAARKETFGSNAPLALALMGMMLGAMLLTIPSLILCVVALVRNAGEKGKPLAAAKCTVATVTAILGMVMAVAAVTAMVLLGGLANSLDGVLPF